MSTSVRPYDLSFQIGIMTMKKIVVVGGSIIGSSTAYHMAMAGAADRIVVVEPDPTYALAAAPRSAGGVH